jgi:hypothetical protein
LPKKDIDFQSSSKKVTHFVLHDKKKRGPTLNPKEHLIRKIVPSPNMLLDDDIRELHEREHKINEALIAK